MITINPDGVSIKGCSLIYAPKGQAGEYAPLAANPYRGCGHKCAYCLSPDTLIQMADGTTRRLRNVQVGDDLIGIVKREEQRRSWNYTYERSTVLAKIASHKQAFQVSLANGQTAICSADHRWFTERGWKPTSRLTTNNFVRVLGQPIETPPVSEQYRLGYLAGMIRGDGTMGRYDYSGRYTRVGKKTPQKTDVQHSFRLALKDAPALARSAEYLEQCGVKTKQFAFASATEPMQAIRANGLAAYDAIRALIDIRDDSEWSRGWLAGIFDAEGGADQVLRIHNTDPVILAVTDSALTRFGFQFTRDVPNKESGCQAVRLLGGLSEMTRFFNLTAPAIERKFPVEGSALRGASIVLSVQPLGQDIEMLDITTSTENFIANGMVSHNCYVPGVLRMPRPEFDAGAEERPDYLNQFVREGNKYREAGITEQVMLSFTTDPYHPGDNTLTRAVLQMLKNKGMAFCTLTKGGARALRDIDLFRPNRDAFASTLTSTDAAFSQKWERGAALPDDRMATLKAFHDRGIFTWVSLEPTLDCESSLDIIERTHEYVDLYKVGRANYLPMTNSTDWKSYTERIVALVGRLGVRHYIKKDLQSFLPSGYYNPLRIPQHH